MYKKLLILAIAILVLASMACSFSVNLPINEVKTGPTQVDNINVPNLSSPDAVADVTLQFGAGELVLNSGAQNALVSGTATYNVVDLKPTVTTNGNSVSIETGDLKLQGIPNFNQKYKNEWNLKFGDAPMNLTINSGAYQGRMELGGLSIQSLQVKDGASEVNLGFSQPNKAEMSTYRYETGASNVKLTGLANANFGEMVFKSGAGSYTLDFTGELKRDATVTVTSGVSSINVIVPQGVSARVLFDGGLSNVDIGGGWQKNGNQYTQSGSGPTITINVNMGAGNLQLSN
jgi:hypothetical protein